MPPTRITEKRETREARGGSRYVMFLGTSVKECSTPDVPNVSPSVNKTPTGNHDSISEHYPYFFDTISSNGS